MLVEQSGCFRAIKSDSLDSLRFSSMKTMKVKGCSSYQVISAHYYKYPSKAPADLIFSHLIIIFRVYQANYRYLSSFSFLNYLSVEFHEFETATTNLDLKIIFDP